MSAAAPTVRRIDRKPGKLVPVLVVTLAILAIWYAGAYWMNRSLALDVFARQKVVPTTEQLVDATWSMERPLLPAPHQIAVEVWKTTADQKITSKRSLVYHAWVTLSATLAGFVSGTLLGILLAIGIVHVASLDKSLMPWVIASQTIPRSSPSRR